MENSKYGWFWDCPNGLKCIYRHALPPGFVLKKDERKEEKEMQISLEDLIEKEAGCFLFFLGNCLVLYAMLAMAVSDNHCILVKVYE